ncbi:Heavy metal RND efflux outer membrane protein, CzcC family [Labilithrix luteola]|uniref:Heavy metal RND efflux outer membrane protein, CzcC family n=2 Tax=Labilithrix luteola TaxID=1391654 RepID=A0A0K1PRW4_9BACT|nr:Heavy metal RND efflux outer membrane protein, CzcC family [Labilithrix luteola]
MVGRFFALICLAKVAMTAGEASAQGTERLLDRTTVATLAGAHGPNVVVAERRLEEAKAARTGAGVLAPTNPELSVYAGPRWQTRSPDVDYFIGVAWPFDVSGAPSRRIDVADDRARLAQSETDAARQLAIADALDLWASARGAEERVQLENARLALDRSVLRSAEVRRNAGTTGDGEVALARALEAQGKARVATAEHAATAFAARLRVRVGLVHDEHVTVGGSLLPDEPRPLEALLRSLKTQPVVLRSLAAARLAATDASLQRRAGWPVPRVTAGVGNDPETYLHVGVDLPLPVYQRNQTNAAVAAARRGTAETEYQNALALGEAELRATYAEYEGAREAFITLDNASAAVDDAEHLAMRSYELGQTGLTELALARREAAAARSARLDAAIALAKARIALDVLTGAFR